MLRTSLAATLRPRALPATRTGPLYNAVSYPTKISPESIALFIATHTRPGDTVLDVFAGSGTTGIATKLCDRPTARMRAVAADLGLDPQWGAREAVLYEIGAFGSLIARVMGEQADPGRFITAATAMLDQAVSSHGWLYETTNTDGAPGILRYTIWSDVCMPELRLDHLVLGRSCPLRPTSTRGCLRLPWMRGAQLDQLSCERVTDVVYDPLVRREIRRRRRVRLACTGSPAAASRSAALEMRTM